MSDPENEISENGSTGYSDFCDDDAILAVDETLTADSDVPEGHFTAAAEGSSPSATTCSTFTSGKRKYPDDFVLSDRDGPSASYRTRTVSSSIDLESSASSSSGSGVTLPFFIAHNGAVKQAMDARSLPWGIQWEIARLISLGYCSWTDITMDTLDRIKAEGLSPPDPDSPKQAVLCARVAPRLEEFFRSGMCTFGTRKVSREMMATSPWEELDKEDLAFARHGPMGCLGSTPVLGDFYGGKVSFSMRTQFNEHGMFHFILEHPILGHSSRFTRCYGSSFLIRLRLSMDLLSKPALLDRLKQLLIRPVILLGHVFRFFHINKNNHAYLMATNEIYNGGIISQGGQRPGTYCSFLEFFKKHNNLEENSNQTIAKWAARTALGLSNSIPGIILETSQIREENDIVSSSCPPGVRPTSEMDMTDGCGLINLHAMHMLHEKLGLWKEVPVAIQCRLAGAKGLLLLHPSREENSSEHPCVWLRPSQIKINHTESFLDHPAHRIIDTLRASQMQSSVQISREMIINLSENGVSSGIFIDLFCQSMENVISPLLNWDGQDAMARLWVAVAKEGSVMTTRIAHESAWTARARGLQLYEQDSSTEDDDESSHSIAWWGDEISGCPSSLEETIMSFLDTGFHPASNSALAEKLHIVAKKAVKSYISKSRVTIPMSCSALIVPDVLGVLQEGEIHVKCSQRCLLRPDGQRSDRVLGDVLVTKSPCKLPTDTQKVKAVFKPELDDRVNVIVFSIKGSRSLASMLGTGDYDGDRVICIWQPNIVEPFENADAQYMNPPANLHNQFHIKNETVKEYLERVPQTSPINHQIQQLQTILMAPLSDQHVIGTYSTMHDNAMYALGYSHPTTILLAWIFCTVLDGVKTGKTILPERYKEDRESRQYGTQFVPWWKMDPDCETQQYNLSRGDLPPFVMDLLREAMDKVGEEQLRRIADHFAELPKVKDADLVAPWEGAEARAQEMLSRSEEQMRTIGQAQKDALEAIKTHVAWVYDLNTAVMRATITKTTTALAERIAGSSTSAGSGTSRGTVTTMGTQTERSRGKQRSSNSNSNSGRKRRGGSGGRSSVKFTNRNIETRQDQLRRMSREFVGGPPAEQTLVFSAEEVARLRASYAYAYDWVRRPGGSRFPWNVAMRELGEIKLRARKDFKPISQDFYEKMSMRKL